MEQYVTYHKIIKLLELFQQSQENIGLNSFGHGNLVDFGMTQSGMTPVYPFMFVSPQSVSQDENITTYTLQILFGDRINFDMSNEIDVISNMSIQAKRFISYIKRGFNQNPDLYSRMDCNLPITAIPFLERFDDYVGGIAVDIEIIVFEDINACDYYELNPSPTPSVTPTNTVTPTPTVTPSITPTNTPTQTFVSYPVVFVSSGDTFDDICSNPQPIPTLYSPQPFFTNQQQLYYDSGLTQFIDWSDDNNSFFASTGGTQLYFYGFATFGLGTYGFTCPSPSPTPTNTTTPTTTPSITPTNTATPTVTPTKTITPTPTCACYTYQLTNYNPSGSGTYFYFVCPNGTTATVTVSAGQTVQRCSISIPVYSTGSSNLEITKIGNCC
jgi:hypothetical protein